MAGQQPLGLPRRAQRFTVWDGLFLLGRDTLVSSRFLWLFNHKLSLITPNATLTPTT